MKNSATVVLEVYLNEPPPGNEAAKYASQQIRAIVNQWVGIGSFCPKIGRHAVVLDAQRDSGTVAAFLHWCESGNFSYKAHWFTDGWLVHRD